MSSLPVVFEDCSETDARCVSVFELIKYRQEVKNLRRSNGEMAMAMHELMADRDVWKGRCGIALMSDPNAGPVSDFKPLTFWRALGLIALGVALGASFVAFGLPKAHAQGYRMPDYAAPPPVIQYQPLTPPNSLQQGEPQSFSVVPYGSGQSDGLGQLEGSGGVVVNSDGSTVGSYLVTP